MSAQACASTSVREEVVIWPVCSHCERKTSVVGWGISPKVGRKQDYLAICPQHGAIPTWLGESSTPRRQHPVSAGPAAADPKANRGPVEPTRMESKQKRYMAPLQTETSSSMPETPSSVTETPSDACSPPSSMTEINTGAGVLRVSSHHVQ